MTGCPSDGFLLLISAAAVIGAIGFGAGLALWWRAPRILTHSESHVRGQIDGIAECYSALRRLEAVEHPTVPEDPQTAYKVGLATARLHLKHVGTRTMMAAELPPQKRGRGDEPAGAGMSP